MELNAGFPHESLMGLSRKIHTCRWLLCDNFSEMIVDNLCWPMIGGFLLVEIIVVIIRSFERILTNEIGAHSGTKTFLMVDVLRVLQR